MFIMSLMAMALVSSDLLQQKSPRNKSHRSPILDRSITGRCVCVWTELNWNALCWQTLFPYLLNMLRTVWYRKQRTICPYVTHCYESVSKYEVTFPVGEYNPNASFFVVATSFDFNFWSIHHISVNFTQPFGLLYFTVWHIIHSD